MLHQLVGTHLRRLNSPTGLTEDEEEVINNTGETFREVCASVYTGGYKGMERGPPKAGEPAEVVQVQDPTLYGEIDFESLAIELQWLSKCHGLNLRRGRREGAPSFLDIGSGRGRAVRGDMMPRPCSPSDRDGLSSRCSPDLADPPPSLTLPPFMDWASLSQPEAKTEPPP